MQLTIQDVGFGGEGIARTESGVVFVPGAFIGEVVEAEIVSQKKKFARAKLTNIVKPSPDRIQPETAVVPGMTYAELRYEAEVALKDHQLRTLLQRIGRFESLDFVGSPTASPITSHYRNKLVLHSNGQQLGYIGDDNTTLVPIEACPLSAEPINQALAAVIARGQRFKDGERVTFRYTPQDGVTLGCPPRGTLTESVAGLTLQVAAEAFFQINLACAERLLTAFREQFDPCDHVLDLYCGCGLFGFVAAQAGARRLSGLETTPGAVISAQANAKRLGIEASYKCAPSESLPQTTADTWIVDPPRFGLSDVVREKIKTSKPRTIHYISCGPDTLARDLKDLAQLYTIERCQVFDFFPRTPHFETLTKLSLKA